MIAIDADDRVVGDLLASLIETVADAGGWLHPDARLVERHGGLSLHCSADDDGPLVMIPPEAMVRVGRVTWSTQGGILQVVAVPDDVVGTERELLYLMTGLLNQCGKVPGLLGSHPALAPLDDSLIEAVRALRPGFRRQSPDPAGLLWSTRCFRALGAGPDPVAVPIIDLLNHRTHGACAAPHDGGLLVAARRTPDGDECFLDYGYRRDAVGMALVYGFADQSADIAHSAPLEVRVPGVGDVIVAARGRDASGALLPIAARAEGGRTVLSRVSFGLDASPTASIAGATGWTVEQSGGVVAAVADANRLLLEAIVAAATDGASGVIARAAGIQSRVIDSSLEGASGDASWGAWTDIAVSEDSLDSVAGSRDGHTG